MELTEERKNEKRFHTGRLMAVVGTGIIAYCWLKGKFKDLKNNFFLTDGKQEGCLVINDENESEYIQDHENEAYCGKILYVPAGITNIIVETSKRRIIHNLMPMDGDFADGTRIRILGRVSLRPPRGEEDEEEYQFSSHIYADIANNNGGKSMLDLDDRNGCELLCYHKQWWFII